MPNPLQPASGGSGAGDVVGPALAIDNAAARYNSTTGKLLQGSALIIGDVAAGVLPLSADDGATAQIDIELNSKGAGSRYNFKINGTIQMDLTDVGGGVFDLRIQTGNVQVGNGKYTGGVNNNVTYANGGNWVEVEANGGIVARFADASIGFLGKVGSPAAAQTGGAATAGVVYTATEQAMLQAAYDCLRTFGLLT